MILLQLRQFTSERSSELFIPSSDFPDIAPQRVVVRVPYLEDRLTARWVLMDRLTASGPSWRA